MKIVHLLAAFAALATAALLSAAPASAQASRTWVSGVGDDANPCSRTAPCKTFAGAISKTAAAGEIDCLDPGGFGAVTITKAMTIDCLGLGNGGVIVSGTNGIVVNAGAGDDVQLIGLDINGFGPAATSFNGVKLVQAGSLAVLNCLIYGFQNSNGTDGAAILIAGQNGAHVEIANTVMRNNTFGVLVSPPGAVINGVLIEHSLMDKNAAASLSLANSGAVVVLNGDSLIASPASIDNSSGGQVISYGNNMIRNGGSPTSTVPLQ
jgi:hypothetical protein